MRGSGLKFKTAYRTGSHNWHRDDESDLTTLYKLSCVKNVLEKLGSIVIEHWIYCGRQAPSRQAFDDYDDFIDYLTENARAGDLVDIWSLHELISKKNRLTIGKCPAGDGSVPESGAY